MRREESLLILRMWPAATPGRRVVREHLLDEQDAAGQLRGQGGRDDQSAPLTPEVDVGGAGPGA